MEDARTATSPDDSRFAADAALAPDALPSSFLADLAARCEASHPGLRDRIEMLHARGKSSTDIRSHLTSLYGEPVAPAVIEAFAGALRQDAAAWRLRPLASACAMMFLGSLRARMRGRGTIRERTIVIALGLHGDGAKEVLGFWLVPEDGAGFWVEAMRELKARGLRHVKVVVGGDNGAVREAVASVFLETQVLPDMRRMFEQSMATVAGPHRPAVAKHLRAVAGARDESGARARLAAFGSGEWGRLYPSVCLWWRCRWQEMVEFFALPAAVRDVVLGTDAVASLSAKLRRDAVRMPVFYASENTALAELGVVLRKTASGWRMAPKKWRAAKSYFSAVSAIE